jgi:Bacterial regulatory proteins, luxR family
VSDREREVLALMAQGLTNAGLAAELFVSSKTIEGYVRNIFTKLDLPPAHASPAGSSPYCDSSARSDWPERGTGYPWAVVQR